MTQDKLQELKRKANEWRTDQSKPEVDFIEFFKTQFGRDPTAKDIEELERELDIYEVHSRGITNESNLDNTSAIRGKIKELQESRRVDSYDINTLIVDMAKKEKETNANKIDYAQSFKNAVKKLGKGLFYSSLLGSFSGAAFAAVYFLGTPLKSKVIDDQLVQIQQMQDHYETEFMNQYILKLTWLKTKDKKLEQEYDRKNKELEARLQELETQRMTLEEKFFGPFSSLTNVEGGSKLSDIERNLYLRVYLGDEFLELSNKNNTVYDNTLNGVNIVAREINDLLLVSFANSNKTQEAHYYLKGKPHKSVVFSKDGIKVIEYSTGKYTLLRNNGTVSYSGKLVDSQLGAAKNILNDLDRLRNRGPNVHQ